MRSFRLSIIFLVFVAFSYSAQPAHPRIMEREEKKVPLKVMGQKKLQAIFEKKIDQLHRARESAKRLKSHELFRSVGIRANRIRESREYALLEKGLKVRIEKTIENFLKKLEEDKKIFKMVETKGRFLNGIIISDPHLGERGFAPWVLGYLGGDFWDGLKSAAASIIASGSVIQSFLKRKDAFLLVQDFDIYRHKNSEAFLFVFIPRKYKDSVINDWRSCQKSGDVKGKLQEEEYALGICTQSLKKLSLEQLKEFVENEKVEGKDIESAFVAGLKDLFVRNKQVPCGGTWNFYLVGHGFFTTKEREGVIANLSHANYLGLLKFFDQHLRVKTLTVNSCYSGGIHMFLPYQEAQGLGVFRMGFDVIHLASTDAPIFGMDVKGREKIGGQERDFTTYFSRSKSRSIPLSEALVSLARGSEYDRRVFYSIFPFLLSGYFRLPINIYGERALLINDAMIKAHRITKKPIQVKKKTEVVTVLPNIIPATLDIEDTEGLVIFSIFPGSGFHFFDKIKVRSGFAELKTFFKVFRLPIGRIHPKSQKTFFIKELVLSNGEVFQNLVAGAYPSEGSAFRMFLFHEKEGKLFKQFLYSGHRDARSITYREMFEFLRRKTTKDIREGYLHDRKLDVSFSEKYFDYRKLLTLIANGFEYDLWKKPVEANKFLWDTVKRFDVGEIQRAYDAKYKELIEWKKEAENVSKKLD